MSPTAIHTPRTPQPRCGCFDRRLGVAACLARPPRLVALRVISGSPGPVADHFPTNGCALGACPNRRRALFDGGRELVERSGKRLHALVLELLRDLFHIDAHHRQAAEDRALVVEVLLERVGYLAV